MDAQRLLTILRERWMATFATALLVIGAAIGGTALQSPTYEATASIFVRTQSGNDVFDRSAGADYARQQIATYADLTETPLILDPAIRSLRLDATAEQIADRVSTSVPENTLLIRVTALATSPDEAAALANAVADSLRVQVSSLEGPSGVELTVVTPAVAPGQAASPNIVQNVVLGFVAALLAGVVVALLRDLLDNKVRKVEDIHLMTDAPLMATVPAVRARCAVTMLSDTDAQGVQAESYRELRTNLRFLDTFGNTRSLVVTSSVRDEGKTTTSINLAAALARSGRRVLLVDADLRNPSVHHALGLEGGAGLTTVLIGDAELEDVVQPLEPEGLFVLASGQLPPNPNELLDSALMTRFLEAATYHYDMVILDSSPVLAASDATALARQVSGTLFVAGSGRVRRHQFGQALQKLQMVQGQMFGIVLNGVPRSDHTTYTQVYGAAAPELPTHRRRPAPTSTAPRETSVPEHPRDLQALEPPDDVSGDARGTSPKLQPARTARAER